MSIRQKPDKRIEKIYEHEQQGIFHIYPGETLCSLKEYASQVIKIKQLVSVTDKDFTEYYLQPLYHFANYVQRLPYPDYQPYCRTGRFLSFTLDLAVITLKFRLGHMLPLGSDTETCYQEDPSWTYGLFIATLLEDCWKVATYFSINLYRGNKWWRSWDPLMGVYMPTNRAITYRFEYSKTPDKNESLKTYNAFLIRTILKIKHYAALYKHYDVFKAWLSHIDHRDASSPISMLIQSAKEALTKKKTEPKPTQAPAAYHASVPEKYSTFKKETVKIFIAWLQNSIRQKKLSVNQSTSIVHILEDGVFLKMPNILQSFIESVPNARTDLFAKNENHAGELFIEKIRESDLFAAHNENYLHEHCQGEWQDQNLVSGLIISDVKMIFRQQEQLACSKHLYKNPIE